MNCPDCRAQKSSNQKTKENNFDDEAAFDYFTPGDATKRIAYYNGAAKEYWTRLSGSYNSTAYVQIVNTAGARQMAYDLSTTSRGVRPTGILSADAIIDSDFNVIAP